MNFSLVLAIIAALLGALLYKPLKLKLEILGINREVKNIGWEKCTKVLEPTFCEDAVIDHARGLVFLSCDSNRRRYNTVVQQVVIDDTLTDGEIWMYELNGRKLTKLAIANYNSSFHPLGIAVDTHGSGSHPNIISLLATNVGTDGPSILHLSLDISQDPPVLTHLKTITSPKINTPNSVVPVPYQRNDDGTPSFFVSNDHFFVEGFPKVLENWLGLPLGSLAFYNARQGEARVVERGFQFTNGIAEWGPEVGGLFVAETFNARLTAYRIDNMTNLNDGSSAETVWPQLTSVGYIHLGYGVDNVQLEPMSGDVIVAGHPTVFDLIRFVEAPMPNVGGKEHPAGFKKPGSMVDRVSVKHTEKGIEMQLAENLFHDDGEKYTTSSTGAIDKTRERMIVTGLYEYGFLDCKI